MLNYWEFINESNKLLQDEMQEVVDEYENIMKRLMPIYTYMSENKMSNHIFELLNVRFDLIRDNVDFINTWPGKGIDDFKEVSDMKMINKIVYSYKLLQTVETFKFPKHSKYDEVSYVLTDMCDEFKVPIELLYISKSYYIPSSEIKRNTEFPPHYEVVLRATKEITEFRLGLDIRMYLEALSDYGLELITPIEMDRMGDESWLVKLNIEEID